MDWFEPTLKWYATTTLITIAFAPLVLLIFQHVFDRGASVMRTSGMLLLIWPIWFLASIGDGVVPYVGITLWIAVAILAVACWAIGMRAGILNRSSLKHIAIAESVHLMVFAAFLALRGFIPAVAGPNIIDQEKPMDLMMLSSSMRATSMPPADAWLSGEPINYYYLGYAMWGGIGNMIGTTPGITYNLAVTSIFAMTVVAVFGTVANILAGFTSTTISRAGGVIGALLIVFIGNPWAAWQIFGDVDAEWEADPFGGVMWNATRIIEITPDIDAISEFPAFSFIFADMHPHLMAMPFTISALAFAWMFASLPERSSRRAHVGRLVIAGISVTALYALNSWDFPTWFAVVALGVLISPGFQTAFQRIVGIGVALVAGIIAWSPFLVKFDAPVRIADSAFADVVGDIPVIGSVLASIGGYTGERTSIVDYFSIFGFFYPVLVVALVLILFFDRNGDNDPLVERLALVSAILLIVIGILLPAPLVILLGIPALAGMVIVLRSGNVTLELVIAGLATLSFVLTLIPEFFYLLDAFGNRMNTIFKLYLQVWVLSGVATALALIWLWQRAAAWRPGTGLVAFVGAAILVTGLTYPVVAGHQWAGFKNRDSDWVGVDGLAWLNESHAADPATYDALQWLWQNGSNDDVILAAGGCAYRAPVGLPSAASGVPSIIGWANHERQWHLGNEALVSTFADRVTAINELFARPTDELLDEYGVTLLYIGRPETSGVEGLEASPECAPGPFPEATSPEFPGPGWTEVFSEDGVRILRRDSAN